MKRSYKGMSRLALSILYGVLQALVAVTLANLGQIFLRRSYNVLCAEVGFSDYVPAKIFYYKVVLRQGNNPGSWLVETSAPAPGPPSDPLRTSCYFGSRLGRRQ